MMDKMLKLKKKSGKEMSPVQKEAKMSVLSQLKEGAEQMMGDKLKGLKKVTVASDSPEGLEKGLDKAKEIMGMDEESEDEASELTDLDDQPMHEEAEESEEVPMSEEELDAKLQELMALKEKMKAKA